MRALPLLLLLGCQDYGLNNGTKPGTGSTETTPSSTTSSTPPLEVCDGQDNDGDGQVDEGFDDFDGDGIADCVDDGCELAVAPPQTDVDPSCQGGTGLGVPPANPWDWVIEWQWLGGAVYATPSVGDLDRDGTPEVVVNVNGALYAFDGATGTVEWSAGANIDAQSGTALGDLDGDGFGDIVTSTGSCFTAHTVVAFDDAGNPKWSTPIGNACETYPVIADLEGDGDVEVIVDEYVLDGATGAVLFTLPILGADNWGAPVAADLDLDGVMEILLEGRVYDAAGTFLWQCATGGTGTFPQPVNVDADPEGEVLVAAPSLMTLCDDDGTVLWTRPHSSYGSAIAVADFDGDGQQEFAFANSGTLALIDADGTTRWTTPINDFSGLAGCTSWDIDLDGVPEVVYADEQDILVVDGATGAVVLRDSDHGSITLAPTPAVADVDGDGHGELIYGSDLSITGLTVIGSADGDWPYSPPVYNQYGYYGANIGSDLSVPAQPDPPWVYSADLFRGQPSAVYFAATANLHAAITDVCVASCKGRGLAEVAVQVWNDGGDIVPAGTTVRLYGVKGGTSTLIDEQLTPADLAPGTSWEYSVSTTVQALGDALDVVADEPGDVVECSEADNHGAWTAIPSCG